jgi:hypothetical protein
MIVLAVRWYLRFALSYRDVEELLAEQSIEVDDVTIYRWVQRFTPLLAGVAWELAPAPPSPPPIWSAEGDGSKRAEAEAKRLPQAVGPGPPAGSCPAPRIGRK